MRLAPRSPPSRAPVEAAYAVLALWPLLASCENARAHLREIIPVRSSCCAMRLISFEDERPPGRPLDRFWHGLGMDAQKRVYVAIGTGEELHGRPGDVHIFRYDTRLGTKE